MKIVIMGTRGVPARYGGFETCVEEIGWRLAERGHEIWVCGRSGYYRKQIRDYRGMNVITLPELRIRSMETLGHSFLSLVFSLRRPFDIYLMFNTANSIFLPLPLILKKTTILHTDGLEWKRGKWGSAGRLYHRLAERFAARLNIPLVTDSEAIRTYYREVYGRDSHFISYGADLENSRDPGLLDRFGIRPGGYFLQITRFEPENNPHLTVEAFGKLKTDKKLVLVGGTTYRGRYTRVMDKKRDGRILMPGFVYDRDILRELLCNCYAYVHGNEVGGTNPALLQAMGSGAFIVARDVLFNREVLRDAGIFFVKSASDLAGKMAWTLENPDKMAEKKDKSRAIIREHYNWDKVTRTYENLFHSLSRGCLISR